MNGKTSVYAYRDAAMILLVAAIFVLAVVYSVYSATTIGANVNTGGTLTASGVSTLSGAVYASSTLQATGDGLFYDQLSAGASTNSPTTTFNVTGSGYFTGGLGVGFATTGAGELHITGLGVFERTIDVRVSNATSTFAGGITAATSGNSFGVGTTSPTGKVGFTGSPAVLSSGGTTTLSLDTAGTTQGGCLELKGGTTQGLNSRWIKIYVGGTAATNSSAHVITAGGFDLLVIEEGRC